MKVKGESFWKFIVVCLRTGNKELAKKLIKQNKNKVMKAHEAPKSKFVYPNKLYARTNNNITLDISYAPQTLEAVEYTRTDVFIDEAEKYLLEHLIDYWSQVVTDESGFIEEFKNYNEMRIRIARKICKRLGHGYPIDNIHRIEDAVRTWEKACKRFKHWKRSVKQGY